MQAQQSGQMVMDVGTLEALVIRAKLQFEDQMLLQKDISSK